MSAGDVSGLLRWPHRKFELSIGLDLEKQQGQPNVEYKRFQQRF